MSVDNRCAVRGCKAVGVAHRCLGDGSTHHHGRIHYDCDRVARSNHGLTFDDGDWRLICDLHYGKIRQAMKAVGLWPIEGDA